MTDKKLTQLSPGTTITAADLFYSAPLIGGQVKQTAEALKSFMFPGFIDAMDPTYGIVTGLGQSSGQRTTNGTGLNAASTAAGVAGKLLLLPPAPIEFSATATDGGINVGFQLDYRAQGLIGWGSTLTRLVQYASNHPVLTLGTVSNAANIMQHATIRGIGVGTGVSQAANTSGHGVVIGNIAWCIVEDIFVDPFIAGGSRTDVYIGMINPGVNSIGQFENWFNNITIKSGAFEFLELSGNSTGSTWGPVYIGDSSNFFVDWRTPASNAIVFNNQTSIGTFLELNVEWIQSPSGVTSGIILFNNCRGGAFDQIRIEGTRLTGADPNLIGATLSNISVQSLNLYSCTIASGDVSGTPKILGIYEDSHFSVDNGNWQWNVFGTGTGACTASFYLFGQAGVSGQNRGRIEFRNIYMVGNAAGTFNFDSGLLNAVTGDVYEFGRYNYNPGISRVEDPKIIINTFASTYQLYGWAVRPEIVVNCVLTAAMTINWLNTCGPSGIGLSLPASSSDQLMLTRSPSSTGAFNLLVNDASGNTLATLASASTVVQVPHLVGKIALSTTLNLYVSPSGSDTTGDGSSGSPWQTIQHAVDYVHSYIDIGSQSVLINLANGTYAGFTVTNISGAVGIVAAGAVTISGSGFALIYGFDCDVTLTGGGTFTFTNSASGSFAILTDIGGYIQILAGTTLQFTAGATDTIHCISANGGRIENYGTVSITGNFDSHMNSQSGGTIHRGPATTTFVSSPTVGTAFAVATTNGSMNFDTTQTFTGTLTGKKYQATLNGTIQSNAQTLPGTVAGTTATGGQYA